MNDLTPKGVSGSFAASIFDLLDRVEYRRMRTAADFEEVGRLRRISYEAKDFIDTQNFGSFVDEHDCNEDCYVIGVYINEKLVSTVRTHIVSASHLHGPSVALFPQQALRILDEGHKVIDPSRFATDPLAMWQYPAVPFLTLRAVAMAAEYFSADYCMSVVREDTASFYRRCFGSIDLSAPQMVPGYSVPLIILAAKIAAIHDKIATRYPFFKSKPHERKMMFAPQHELAYPSLNILPTAKYAHMTDAKLAAATFPELMPV